MAANPLVPTRPAARGPAAWFEAGADIRRRARHPAHGTRRFVTCTASVAEPRSNVAVGEMFLAMTRTVLLDDAAASNSMKRIDDTSAARRCPPAVRPRR